MTVGSHLSTDVVSDLLEGLLSESDRVAAEAHLASCAECTELAEALVGVRDVLRSAPPPPMPADVFERLNATLAVESAERADSTGVVSLGQARERRLSRKAGQFLIAAASVAVLAVGGGIVVNSVTSKGPIAQIPQNSSTPTTKTAAGDLYLAHGTTAPVSSASFAADAEKLLTTTKPSKPRPTNGGQGIQASPEQCVRDALPPTAGTFRDFTMIDFDGESAYLAITNPTGTNDVVAYAITGCAAGEGTVSKSATLPR